MVRREAVGTRDPGFPGGADADFGAFLGQPGTCRLVDRSRDATTGRECVVGGVHDGIDGRRGDVAEQDFDRSHGLLAFPLSIPLSGQGIHRGGERGFEMC